MNVATSPGPPERGAGDLDLSRIGTIEGIIIDTSVFDNEPVHPSWPADDLNRWYACEVSGLNFNDNCVDVLNDVIKHYQLDMRVVQIIELVANALIIPE